MRRILILIVLLAVLLAGCTATPTGTTQATTTKPTTSQTTAAPTTTQTPLLNDSGFPIVNEPITLTAFAVKGPYNKGDFNELAIWKLYEEMTGIKVVFTAVEAAQAAEQRGLLFASNQLPDMIFKSGMSPADQTKYADEGSLKPISDYLDYAPNFVKLMGIRPEIEKATKLEDGNIYGFPYLVTASPANISPKLFINQKWASSAGIQMPTTIEQLVAVLEAFKGSDWNGNGQPDEIPLGVDNQGNLYRALYGSFGLGNHGVVNGMWDEHPQTGKIRYYAVSDEYRTFLQYINQLYTKQLVDQEYFTVDLAKFSAKAQQNQIGVCFIHNNNYLGDYKDDFVTLPGPLKGPEATLLYAGRNLVVAGQNTFITKMNKYPEASVRWVDYFYAEEGVRMYFMGIEGETWAMDSNGKPQFTDLVKKNPEGLNMEEVLGRYVAWSGGGNPSIADDLHFGNHLIPKITVDAADALMPKTPQEVWAAFTFSSEDTQRLAVVSQDINTYVDDMRAKFITGNVSFDTWPAYVKTIQDMGLNEYTAIMQRGLDNYLSK
jgi:putative aldouronate transport system substrate-binding protein